MHVPAYYSVLALDRNRRNALSTCAREVCKVNACPSSEHRSSVYMRRNNRVDIDSTSTSTSQGSDDDYMHTKKTSPWSLQVKPSRVSRSSIRISIEMFRIQYQATLERMWCRVSVDHPADAFLSYPLFKEPSV